MYYISDKVAAIRRVQTYLHFIADRGEKALPRVAIDGIFGLETRDAVLKFQASENLNMTGEVDLATFDRLFFVYDKLRKERNADDYVITGKPFPLKRGMQNSDVLNLHLYLNELSLFYREIGCVPKGNYYSAETEKSVRELERIFMFDPTGEVDAVLYQRIVDEVDVLNRLNEKYF